MPHPILVTGAAGGAQGSTGRRVTSLLGGPARYRMVLRSALLQVALGLAIGIPTAIEAGRLMAAELFGIGAWNSLVLGIVTTLLGLVALVASAVPAYRAASLGPMEALRSS